MITLENVSKIIDGNYLFEDVNLTFKDHEKIAIVGKNGTGKSTLLKIILDDDNATSGRVIKPNLTIGYLDQIKQFENLTTWSDLLDLIKAEFIGIQTKMDLIVNDPNFATDNELIESYGELSNKFEVLGGYEFDSQILKIFEGLGFKNIDPSTLLSTFSGGQKTRIALAKILIENPDFLILDEPTNHLDLNSINWLENFLLKRKKAVIVVSHDRFFLQRVCTRVVSIELNKITNYNCRYQDHLVQKQLNFEHQLKAHENQILEIKKLNDFIDKNRKKASKIGQVRDRYKKLEMIKIIEKPESDNKRLDFDIQGLTIKKSNYIDFIDCNIGFENTLISNLNLTVRGGDKIAIVGDNGIGKSTLIKTITKQIKPLGGDLIIHSKLKIGYFEQEFAFENDRDTLYDTISKLMVGQSKTMIRKHLANFLFFKDDVFKKISDLSGGEKVRFLFAKFSLDPYDILILDEPTNHLDLESKAQLEQILNRYQGTILVVSHDRYFLSQVAKSVLYLQKDRYLNFEGDYFEFTDFINQEVVELKQKVKKVVASKKRYRKLDKIMSDIEKVEQLIEELNLKFTDPLVYNDLVVVKQIQAEIDVHMVKLENLYEEMDEHKDC